ncbi:MAG: putative MFS family arabinose efflux permease [Gammaproteobacteria bacterium]|jgi:predicted MFS family arabinose efflux permease
MTGDGKTLHHHGTVFDGWKSISVALYMTLVGYGVLVGIPVISSAWVSLLGFTEVQVGRVAGADLGGLSIGAVVASIIITKVNRQWLVIVSAGIAILANASCIIIVDYEQVLWLRLLAGFGSGMYTAVAVASLGATSKPARAFNMMLFAFAFSQSLEMHILPQLTMSGIYILFIGCFASSLLFVRWVPPYPLEKGLDIEVDSEESNGSLRVEHKHVPKYVPWLVLCAITFTYINIGAYWTYIELASADRDISSADPEWVGRVLVWASFLSILGCLFATVLSNRFGLARPLLVTLIIQSIIVSMLAGGITDMNILISVFMFNFLWIFIDVYQMSTIANVDHSGRFPSLIIAAQGLGQIIGPNMAATILGMGFGYGGVFMMCACATIIGMSIYLFMYLMLRKKIPALADAS